MASIFSTIRIFAKIKKSFKMKIFVIYNELYEHLEYYCIDFVGRNSKIYSQISNASL